MTIRPVVAAQIVPEVFDRIELRRVGGQLDQADVGRYFQSLARVIAGAIPDQDGLYAGRNRGREHAEKGVDCIGVEIRRQDAFGLAGRGTGSSHHVEITILRLPHRVGTRTTFRPDACQRPLLAESRLVLEEDLELLVRVRLADGGELLGQFTFLKSACRAGSAWR